MFTYTNINGLYAQHPQILAINAALRSLSKKVNKPLRQVFATELDAQVSGVVVYLSDLEFGDGGGAIAFEDATNLNVIATTFYSTRWGSGNANVSVPPDIAVGGQFVAVVRDVKRGVHVDGPHQSLTWMLHKSLHKMMQAQKLAQLAA